VKLPLDLQWPPTFPDPGHRSLRHGLRTAVAMSLAFFAGHFGFNNDQLTIIATFSVAALLGMADFTGDRPNRLMATAITWAVGFPLVALGTAVSLHTALATFIMFVVAFVIAFGAVFSGYFSAGANAAIVFFVVATGVPGTSGAIPSRLAGLALGGAVSLIACGWLWPTRAVPDSRLALANVYRSLADSVDEVANGIDVTSLAHQAAIKQAIVRAEVAIAASAWRPGGLSRTHKARMYLLHGSRRIAALLGEIRPVEPERSAAFVIGRAEMLRVQATTMRSCAEALSNNGASVPDVAKAERAKVAFDDCAADELRRRITTSADAPGDAPSAVDRDVADLTATLELARAAILAALQTRILYGVRSDPAETVPNAVLVSTMTVGVPSLRKWLRRARANCTLSSVHLRNSLRLATSLAIARAAVGIFDLKHGFWVMFATLVVVKTSAAGTRKTALGAALGTGLGFVVSSALVLAFGVHVGVYCVALPFFIFAAFYLPGTGNFLIGQASFTMVVVFLFNILVPTGWSVGLLRFEDVLIGSAIGFVVGALMWPKGAASELARAIANLIDAASSVATATAKSLLEGEPIIEGASQRWIPAVLAATTAEDVFSQFLSELHVPPAPILDWSTLIGTGHQLWYGAAIVGGIPVPADAARHAPALQATVTAEVAAMCSDYRHLGQSLRDATPLRLDPLVPNSVTLYPDHPESTFRLLEVHAWVQELMARLSDLDAALHATVLDEASPRNDRAKVDDPTAA